MRFSVSREYLNLLISNKDLERQFENCSTNPERMKLLSYHLEQDPDFERSLKELTQSPVKDVNRSLEARKSGVNEFGANRLFSALVKTNEALSLAPTECDFLPQLFGNRSAILFDLRKYDDCLVNIDLALAQRLPELLKAKLQFRRAKCLKLLNDPGAGKAYGECIQQLESLLSSQIKREEINLKQLEDFKRKVQESWKDLANNNCVDKCQQTSKANRHSNLPLRSYDDRGSHFNLTNRNVNFPVASSQIALSKNDRFGRGVFAAEDIAPGQVVVFEEATASLLCPSNGFRLNYCDHCLGRNPAVLIPCERCDVLFCSEQCWISHGSTHKTVCQILAKVKHNPFFGMVEMVAFRFVLQTIVRGDSVDEVWSKISEATNEENCYSNLVHQLETNEATRDSGDMIARVFKATILCQLLRTEDFFSSEIFPQRDTESQIFKFGSLLVHYFQVVACNAHDINAFFSTPQCPGGDQVQTGSGLYPFCSMFNHSCDPSVVRHSLNGSSVVVTALKAIRKGDQLFDNYGCHYATMGKAQRQSYLWEQYRFRCACQACERNFPRFQTDSDEPIDFVDPTVTDAIREEVHRSIESFNGLLAEMVSAGVLPLEDAKGKLSTVKQHMSLLNRCVVQPHREFEKCQETYKRILCFLTNCFVLERGESMPG